MLAASLETLFFLYYAETKAQISCETSAFVFAFQIVQTLYFLCLKFQGTSQLLWLYNLVCVGPGWKPHDKFSGDTALVYARVSSAASPDSFCRTLLHVRGKGSTGRGFITFFLYVVLRY